MNNNEVKIKYWIDIAEYDLETAKAMFQTKRYLYVGFMCHQSIEKILKAVISKMGEFPPKIHHLIKLSNIAGIYNDMSEEQQTFLFSLNPLNIEARYPVYKDSIYTSLTNDNCKQLIEDTEVLLKWIKKKL